MAVYGYARVSTTEQAENGQSLERQHEMISLRAQMMEAKVDRFFVDRTVSGSCPFQERTAGKEMLDVLQPGDSVIATKLDRMFRSAGDALAILQRLKRKGTKLYLIDMGYDDCASNGISSLVFTIMSAVAQFERERIAERISDVKASQKTKGRFLGGQRAPFGYRVGVGGELVEEPVEQVLIAKMRAFRDQGLSLRKIADAISTDAGRQLHPETVKRALSAT